MTQTLKSRRISLRVNMIIPAGDVRPIGLGMSGPGEVGKLADVVDVDIARSPADLASPRLEPTDQLLFGQIRSAGLTIGR